MMMKMTKSDHRDRCENARLRFPGSTSTSSTSLSLVTPSGHSARKEHTNICLELYES